MVQTGSKMPSIPVPLGGAATTSWIYKFVLALFLDQLPGEWNYRQHPSGQWLADGKQSNSAWFHTPSKNYSCTNKTRNLCDTLAVVLVLCIQYGDSMQARAGSSSSPARICPSIAKRQKHSQVPKQHFNDLGFLNSIILMTCLRVIAYPSGTWASQLLKTSKEVFSNWEAQVPQGCSVTSYFLTVIQLGFKPKTFWVLVRGLESSAKFQLRGWESVGICWGL